MMETGSINIDWMRGKEGGFDEEIIALTSSSYGIIFVVRWNVNGRISVLVRYKV